MANMLRGFREFISRGNVVELAVAVVIGAAFGALVTSLVADLITPLIAMIFGEPDFSDLTFTVNGSKFTYGSFLNALFAFLTVAAAIYFLVVTPMNKLEERRRRGQDPDTKECPYCLSEIPAKASRCAHCTAELGIADPGPDGPLPG
jgi:large conductance mechanosensitive channel